MIQDIAPKKLNNVFQPHILPVEESVVFYFKDRSVLVRSGEGKLFPSFSELDGPDRCIYLFTVGKRTVFLLPPDSLKDIPAGFSFETIREIRRSKSAALPSFFALYTAVHLADWYRVNRFCGVCGRETILDDKERAIRCPHCGNIVYPRINPAVIVGVVNRGRLLVTRYADRRGVDNYALVAGFTEIGETLEQTVQREVMEEVGLTVCNIRYYKSQPWGSASDLLAGFYCDLDGSDEIALDTNELRYAFWAEPNEIKLQTDDWSLTNEMMKRFKEGELC